MAMSNSFSNGGDLNVFTGTCDAFREGQKVCEGNPARGHEMGVRCGRGGPKYVFVGNVPLADQLRYNFETGIWSNDQGEKYKNGERVE